MSSEPSTMELNSRAASADTRQTAQADNSGSASSKSQTLQEYTKARSASSNDCAWLYEFLSSDAISTAKIDPLYQARVYYREPSDASTTITKAFGTGQSALLELERCLASKHVLAIILCHRDSSRVDPKILDLLWTKFTPEVSFMRHHFDYKEFRDEEGCPATIQTYLKKEYGTAENFWTFGGRWNPIRLPSETCGSILRLSVGSECLSVCHRKSVIIAFVRSKGIYQATERYNSGRKKTFTSSADLYPTTADKHPSSHELSGHSSGFSYSIVHFYARLLVLKCNEDYVLLHDTQPINLSMSDRIATPNNPYIEAIYGRRLELVKLRQDLSGYLGPAAAGDQSFTTRIGIDSGEGPYLQKLQGLLTDVDMLLSLYDHVVKIYEWHIHDADSHDKGELASEQLEEVRESKATAISLGKLSNVAFLYLPINVVCAMLSMNLSILGQGEVPTWVFIVLVLLFGLLTYLPVLISRIDERRVRPYRVAFHLSRRSIPAGFWFLAFLWTHNYGQNFEIMNSGLTQVLLGYPLLRAKGWTEINDKYFKDSTWGNQAFWKSRVREIFLAVEELRPNNEPTALTV